MVLVAGIGNTDIISLTNDMHYPILSNGTVEGAQAGSLRVSGFRTSNDDPAIKVIKELTISSACSIHLP